MLLAALPATPVQLAHACYQLGFEIVVPASWGDELVAHAVLEDLRGRDREPVIQCTCPLVSERLLANGQHLLPSMVQTASPAVAAARYARHAFAPRDLSITYVGACPGARHPVIDERCLPDELLRALAERDIGLSDMPTVFDSVLPPDRRRFVSLPGGCPTQEALWQASEGRMLREVTQPTFSTDLAQTLVWREHVMVDVAPSLGCACAGSSSRLGARSGRVAVMAVEPPRATQPVVNYREEFAAASAQPVAMAEPTNGDAPLMRTPRTLDEGKFAPAGGSGSEHASTSRSSARSRVRTTTPLPRAYLAKRRHLGAGPAAAAPAAVEPQTETSPAQRSVAAQNAAEPTPVAASSAPAPQPNEQAVADANEAPSEPVDVSRPIAVHVESESSLAADVPAQQVQATAQEAAADAPPDLQGQLFIDESQSHESRPPAALNESQEWTAPADVLVIAEQLVEDSTLAEQLVEDSTLFDESPRFIERSGPLRVEVEIFEESEPAAVPLAPAEAVLPDAAESDAAKSVAGPDTVIRPRSAWADFLIALWLVLVASAVVAALLWRR